MRVSLHTSLAGLSDTRSRLEQIGVVSEPPSYTRSLCLQDALEADIVFTNPNNLSFVYDQSFLSQCSRLRYILTASTGTLHIDLDFCEAAGVQVFKLTHDAEFMSRVTATAEHALCLTLAAARKLRTALRNIEQQAWDWENCVGQQLSSLQVGIIGFGRLGKLYHQYVKNLFGKTVVYDPFVDSAGFTSVNFVELHEALESDVVSIHIHASKENLNWFDSDKARLLKSRCILVNTSRGEVVEDQVICDLIKSMPGFFYATDVIAGELESPFSSPLFKLIDSEQLLVTPHIGGMTEQSRQLAYNRVVDLFLRKYDGK